MFCLHCQNKLNYAWTKIDKDILLKKEELYSEANSFAKGDLPISKSVNFPSSDTHQNLTQQVSQLNCEVGQAQEISKNEETPGPRVEALTNLAGENMQNQEQKKEESFKTVKVQPSKNLTKFKFAKKP